MNRIQFERRAVAMASLLFIAQAQTGAQAQQAVPLTVLESVVVTGTAEQPESITKPFSVIGSDELNASGANTLGEALRYQPGVSATGFGPNSSRPIIRGQDSDRIKILRNSAATVDVSALSFDHALPVDPFALHQVEILRGPAALAYGGNAVGGVVNLVDQRIARTPVQGLRGEVNLLGGGAADQTAGGFKLDGGLGQGVSLHLDGFKRTTGDLKTPSFTDPEGVTGRRVQNSSSKSDGAAIGASVQTGDGYIGVSAERYNNEYGVPKKLGVRIGMESERYALEGEQRFQGAVVQNIKYRLAKTDYKHQEFDEGEPETVFLNDGVDGRVEFGLRPFSLGGFNVSTQAGLQFERTDFSAIGDEAFVPATSTNQTGVFSIFRASTGKANSGVFEFGVRAEQVDVNAATTGDSGPTGPVAGTGVDVNPGINRNFSPSSVSLGYTAPIGNGWSLGGSVSRVERAPSSFELYADGVHVATDAYEKGNPTLEEERGRHFELTSTWAQGASKFSATAFSSRYSNYIALIGRTGADSRFDEDEDGDGDPTTGETLQVFDFTAVPAEFKGLEIAYQTAYRLGAGQLQPAIQYDLVRGKRTDGGGNLPRISPQRVVTSLAYSQQGWTVTPELVWVDKSKAGEGDTPVDSYQLLNLRVGKAFTLGTTGGEVFANLQNLTNELAFSATTLNTVRGFTPLAGRSALVGVKLVF